MCRRILAFLICLTFVGMLPADKRPNFVWLISEDNSIHYLNLFDPHGAKTPNIEKLAKHGLIYDHAFSNSPVCSVARTTLITGCYAPRIGTQYHRRSALAPMPKGLRMFPAYMREAGYYTTNNSKKDYNAVEGPGVWDESSRSASWRKRKSGQPFFHKQSFGTSHEGSLHFSAKVMQTQKTTTDPKSVFVAPYHPNTKTFRYTYARYHDRIIQVDREIGAVVDRLADDGLLEDTFIFYFGDHGGVLPRGKGYAYESGLHVPLVLRVPDNWKHLVGHNIGSRVTGFVSFIDFGPTVLHLAGVPVPDAVDGQPFLGESVTAKEVNRRDEAFGYADRFDEKYDLVRTLRKGRFEYVRSYQPFNFDGLQNNYRYKMLAYAEWRQLYHEGKLNEVQRQFFEPRAAEALFDIESDPHETKNLAGDPKFAAKLADMRRRLSERVRTLPDLSMIPENVMVTDAIANPTVYGKQRQSQIAVLVDTADLSLLPFAEAETKLRQALESSDPWQRYWALISCSSHGEAAASLTDVAKSLAKDDPENLVRVRAAEFLGLIGAADPQPVIVEALKNSRSEVETTLILNTLVLLRDGKPGYEFKLPPDLFKTKGNPKGNVNRRLAYLRGEA